MKACIPRLSLRDIEKLATNAWIELKKFQLKSLIRVPRKRETSLLNAHRLH